MNTKVCLVITTIRDGLDTSEKIVRRKPKEVKTSLNKEDYFISVVRAMESIQTLNTSDAAKFIRDPYGIALLLSPVGVKRDDLTENAAEIPEITSKEYYLAVNEGRIDEIWPKLTTPERIFSNLAAQDLLEVAMWDLVRVIGRSLEVDMELLRATYQLQPDPEALAFALASPRAVIEGVTPALGIPLKMAWPSSGFNKIRFPCIIEENLYSNEDFNLVHVHRSADWFSVYDMEGAEFELSSSLRTKLRNVESSYVLEGFVDEWGAFKAVDLLCWNDIWLHVRPLSERVKMLWRFHEWNMERFVVRSYKQLNSFAGEYVLRNLNAPYNPSLNDSHILISGKIQTGILKVGGRKGGLNTPHLLTKEGNAIFAINAEIEKEEWGSVVECSSDGKVLRVLGRGVVPDSYMELSDKWGLDSYDAFSSVRLEVVEWPEREGNL